MMPSQEVVSAVLADCRRAFAESARLCEDEHRAIGDIADGLIAPRFTLVYCSQCGRDFGPGDSGFSHCEDHAGRRAMREAGQ